MAEPKKRISDIVPRRPSSARATAGKESPVAKPVKRATKKKEPAQAAPLQGASLAPSGREPDFFSVTVRETRIDAGPPPVMEEEAPLGRSTATGEARVIVRRRMPRRGIRIVAISLAVLVAAGAGAWFLLPKAVVALTMKKHPVTFSETVVVAADPASVSAPGAVVIPGETLEARANLTLPFATQNTETVSARATGVLTVYNSFSSAPQTLVANTRFESPDKKIFRIQRQVIVPGAKVEGGTITPASIEVAVVAEEAGEAYNLPASSGWRIPGFAGRPQYEGFYAEAKQGMKNGFIGERAKPSAAELANARVELLQALTDSLESQFLIILSDRFTALPGSRRVTLVEEDVSADEDDTHVFHFFGEAVMQQIVFEDPTLKDALMEKAGRSLQDEFAPWEFSYELGTSTANFAAHTLTFAAEGEGTFTEPFDADAFRASVAGKEEAELKAAVFAIPGVEAATVSLSPFFVRSVPENPEKIEVTVE